MTFTKPQLRVLAAAHAFVVEHGYFPTTRELAKELGMSQGGVHWHLSALHKSGALTGPSNMTRVLKLSDEALSAVLA